MDPKLFYSIAIEINSHKNSLMRIHSVGEPLLWNGLPKALHILRESGINSWLFTCAVTSDRALLSNLCE
jgi:hypothetical protein